MEARTEVWAAIVAGRTDGDGLLLSLTKVDPNGSAPDFGEDEAMPRFELVRAADVVCRPVERLLRDRVARGLLSLFVGDPRREGCC